LQTAATLLYLHRVEDSSLRSNKETLKLNNIIDEMDLTDIYRVFHPTTVKHTFSQQIMEHSSE
jgi:hypothetical protein